MSFVIFLLLSYGVSKLPDYDLLTISQGRGSQIKRHCDYGTLFPHFFNIDFDFWNVFHQRCYYKTKITYKDEISPGPLPLLMLRVCFEIDKTINPPPLRNMNEIVYEHFNLMYVHWASVIVAFGILLHY